MIKILIADDDKNLRNVLRNELSEAGFVTDTAESGPKTLEHLGKGEYDILLLDLNMPGLGGMDILKTLKTAEMPVEVIILTAHATVPTAVEAMKLGAYDYLTKPFKLEELKAVIDKAYEKKGLLRENLLLREQIQRQAEAPQIITQSSKLIEILETSKKIALSDLPVLISGESGVGKELIARAIHDASKRADGPFLPINCGAIPETMLESELFGHEKGAFTGAYTRKMGLLEIANHGILFLDEIGELTAPLQGKLLRIIEAGSFFRVGGTKEVSVDVRFVSATNQDIKRQVEKGGFRMDLYYRLSALSLFIPPLRERKEDIPLLIEYIIRNNPAFKQKKFTAEALKVLGQYDWPGNVRELQNMVHRTLLLSRGNLIERDDLPADLVSDPKRAGQRLEDVEKEHILKVLKQVGGQKTKAAEILGLDPKTLYRKLLGYGVEQ